MDINSIPSFLKPSDIPVWSFDGSSTQQAEGRFSDLLLKPVKLYHHSINEEKIPTIYVLCEVMYPDGTGHPANDRKNLTNDTDFWVGFEQEYFLRSNKTGKILGFEESTDIEPQGRYYCGVGLNKGRNVVEEHLDYCLHRTLYCSRTIFGSSAHLLRYGVPVAPRYLWRGAVLSLSSLLLVHFVLLHQEIHA